MAHRAGAIGSKTRPRGAFPRELFRWYATIHAYAARKQLVREGDTTQLNRARPGLLRDDLHGVLYTRGQPLDGVPVSGAFLTAILLTGPETDAALQFGHVQVMARLGKRYRFFPTAPWLDRRRPEITRPEALASSLLTRTARRRLPGAWVRQQSAPDAPATLGGPGAKVVLTLTRTAGGQLIEAVRKVGPTSALTLLVDLDPEADAILVWEPGETTRDAIARPGGTGARIAGNSLMIAPGVDANGARGGEGGFALLLTKQTWDEVLSAIERRRPIEVSGSEDWVSS